MGSAMVVFVGTMIGKWWCEGSQCPPPPQAPCTVITLFSKCTSRSPLCAAFGSFVHLLSLRSNNARLKRTQVDSLKALKNWTDAYGAVHK